MSAPAMPAARLACLLAGAAAGICADTAAVALITAHDHFLHQPGFRRIIAAGSGICSGEPVAVIRWKAAVHALDAGLLPCSALLTELLRDLHLFGGQVGMRVVTVPAHDRTGRSSPGPGLAGRAAGRVAGGDGRSVGAVPAR